MLDNPLVASTVLVIGALVLLTAGVKFTRIVDRLADRTRIGEAVAGAVLLGSATSLPGLATTVTGAVNGDAGFAVSNAVGGIAAQTTFLVLADLVYRESNLEHAAASLPNVLQAAILIALIGIVLAVSSGPDVVVAGVHPASVALVGVYVYGLGLVRRVHQRPMWRPHATVETVLDIAGDDTDDTDGSATSTRRLWLWFAGLALVVGTVGFAIGHAGLALADQTGLSGSVVAAVLTSVVTSLPELVTVMTAVRIGALTLAVSNIVGGNTFDVLFVAAADIAFRDGSVFHAIDRETSFLLSLTVVLTAMLIGGLLVRDKRYIGFEGIAILTTYVAGIAMLFAI